ncbi:SDR family NAD(P)-dependent oxidoreductase, partial [Escherichia coli]|uniref:SDR family NAD(P)-dependent oxidoreductase n=2 Tax=Gammaproteobacteria TaxID=1236 RepID=UPI0021188B52
MSRPKSLKLSQCAAAIVTGAGSGIGRSFALELARRGGTVLCVDIHPERAEQTAAQVDELGGRGLAYTCD